MKHVKLWWLLVSKYTYFPIPQRWQAEPARLPQALALLPLTGLVAGLLNMALVRYGWALPYRWLAALMLFGGLVTSGGWWLRDLLSVASGLKPPPMPPHLAALTAEQAPPSPPPLRLNKGALLTGCLYLLLQYGCFFLLLRLQAPLTVYVAAAVTARFVYLWGVYDFAAQEPAFLHRGFSRRDFQRSALTSLLLTAACAWPAPLLLPALIPPLLAATLFYRGRLKSVGTLDEAAYGAAAAWSELLLYLSVMVLTNHGIFI